ncbi:TPA: LCI fold-containing protein [Bacillus cereus]
MFKKLVVGVLATGIVLTGGIGAASASTEAAHPVIDSKASMQSVKVYKTVKHAENVFANSFYEDGVTWYLKSISYSGGYYYGHYEGWKS